MLVPLALARKIEPASSLEVKKISFRSASYATPFELFSPETIVTDAPPPAGIASMVVLWVKKICDWPKAPEEGKRKSATSNDRVGNNLAMTHL